MITHVTICAQLFSGESIFSACANGLQFYNGCNLAELAEFFQFAEFSQFANFDEFSKYALFASFASFFQFAQYNGALMTHRFRFYQCCCCGWILEWL